MYYAIQCTDKADADELRAQFMQAHTDYLMSQLGMIIWAGARQEDGDAVGSFYLISTVDKGAAQQFIDNDPFAQAGVFSDITVSDVRRGIFQPVLALGAAPTSS